MAKTKKFFKIEDAVQWNWLGCAIHGVVKDIYFYPIVKIIKSKNIKRNGSMENPAYLVQSEAGNFALKLYTELQSGKKGEIKTLKIHV